MKRISMIAAMCLASLFATPAPSKASAIGLAAPLTGTTAGASYVDLSVDLDLNGAASNLVGLELYISFAGLVPLSSTYALGSVFQPFLADLIEIHGVCATLFCNFPQSDPTSPSTYLAAVNVFAPARPTGPGGLFALRFAVDPTASSWALDVLGYDDSALLADACDPADPNCVLDPLVIPFLIAPRGSTSPFSTALVSVDAAASAASVPEPGSLVLLGSGLVFVTRRFRRAR